MEVTPIEVTDGERAVTAMLTGNHSVAVVLIARMDGRIAELEAVQRDLVMACQAASSFLLPLERYPGSEVEVLQTKIDAALAKAR
jgi:hypothetical protein